MKAALLRARRLIDGRARFFAIIPFVLRQKQIRDTAIAIGLAYAVMALPDALGALSAKLGLGGVSSSLFFLWFAALPVPIGALCVRFGAARLVRASLLLAVVACVALATGALFTGVACCGFALAGLANVVLQVAVPVWVSEQVPVRRVAGLLTGGLFVKTLMAVAFPFAVAVAAGVGCWPLALLPFAALAGLGVCRMTRTARPPQPVAGVRRSAERALGHVVRDPAAVVAAAAFAVAIVADVLFCLSIPELVVRRFGRGDATAAVAYAVLFGVKLPVTLLGAWHFARRPAHRTFAPVLLVALAGAVGMAVTDGLFPFLVGVALFAAGFANVYGQVFDAVALRHPQEMPAVASLLVMAVSAGAVASPLGAWARTFGGRAPEVAVLALVALLVPLAAFVTFSRNKA